MRHPCGCDSTVGHTDACLEASRAETREARLVVDANYREIDRLKAEVSAGILASQANARDARAAEDEAERLRGELAELRGALDSSQEENAALAAERNAARSRLEAMRTFDERDADDVGKKAAEVMGVCGLESPSKQKFVRDILWELLKLRAARAFLAGRAEGKPTASEEYWRKRSDTAEGLLYSWLRADCRRLNPNLALSTEVFLSPPEPALSPEAEAAVAAISPAFLAGRGGSPTEPAATPTEKGGAR